MLQPQMLSPSMHLNAPYIFHLACLPISSPHVEGIASMKQKFGGPSTACRTRLAFGRHQLAVGHACMTFAIVSPLKRYCGGIAREKTLSDGFRSYRPISVTATLPILIGI